MQSRALVFAVRWVLFFLLQRRALSQVESSEQSAVLPLNGETFAAALKAHPRLLVKFYAPWCGHCRQLEPEYEKAALALRGRDVTLAKVDAASETALAEQYRIEGYPTLYFFRNGRPEDYDGGRQNATIVQWVEEHMGVPLKVAATEADLDRALRSTRRVASVCVGRGSKELRQIMAKLAEEHERFPSVSFFFVETKEASVVQVYRGLNEVVPLGGPGALDYTTVSQFLENEMLPPFGEIGEDNFDAYLSRSPQGMLWVCFEPDTVQADANRFADVFREVARTFKQFYVVYIDTKLYHEHVKEELGCLNFPTVSLQIGNFSSDTDDPKRYKTVLEEGGVTSQAVAAWIGAVLEGKVEEDDGLEELDESDMEDGDEEDDDDEAPSGDAAVGTEAGAAGADGEQAGAAGSADAAADVAPGAASAEL